MSTCEDQQIIDQAYLQRFLPFSPTVTASLPKDWKGLFERRFYRTEASFFCTYCICLHYSLDRVAVSDTVRTKSRVVPCHPRSVTSSLVCHTPTSPQARPYYPPTVSDTGIPQAPEYARSNQRCPALLHP